jgi:hypothetical protein
MDNSEFIDITVNTILTDKYILQNKDGKQFKFLRKSTNKKNNDILIFKSDNYSNKIVNSFEIVSNEPNEPFRYKLDDSEINYFKKYKRNESGGKRIRKSKRNKRKNKNTKRRTRKY